METSNDKQYVPPVFHTIPSLSGGGEYPWVDNRPQFHAESDLIAAIQYSAQTGLQGGSFRTGCTQQKSDGSVIQRIPGHDSIVLRSGEVITSSDLLLILQRVIDEVDEQVEHRDERDWYRQFSRLPAPMPHTSALHSETGSATPPGVPVMVPQGSTPSSVPSTPSLAYSPEDIDVEFVIENIPLVHQRSSGFIYAKGTTSADSESTTYPSLSKALPRLTPEGENARARHIRDILSRGIDFHSGETRSAASSPSQEEAAFPVAIAALFGEETSRSHRQFLTNMMLLDQLEAQQPYGRKRDKTLSLPALLNAQRHNKTLLGASGDAVPEIREESNKEYKKRKLDSITKRNPGRMSSIKTSPDEFMRFPPSFHGGKAPMAGAASYKMAREPIPAELPFVYNLVQAKEVNVLIHWLEMQVDMDELKAMGKNEALACIYKLVGQRAFTYDMMMERDISRGTPGEDTSHEEPADRLAAEVPVVEAPAEDEEAVLKQDEEEELSDRGEVTEIAPGEELVAALEEEEEKE